MEREGLQPKLQITPLKLLTPELARAARDQIKGGVLLSKEAEISLRTMNPRKYEVKNNSLEPRLFYERDNLRIDNGGFLVEIAPTVLQVASHREKSLTAVQVMENIADYYNRSKEKGYSFLNYDSCLLNLANIKKYGNEKAQRVFDAHAENPKVLARLLLDEVVVKQSPSMGDQVAYVGIDDQGVILGAFSMSDLTNEWNEKTLSLCRTIRIDWAYDPP